MKTALITGATSGFGKAIAIKFASQGMRLIITGRRSNRLLELKSQLENTYRVEVHVATFDIQDSMTTAEAINKLPENWKQVDILVNNAGLAVGKSTIEHGELDDWNRMIDTNVKGILHITRLLIPSLKNSCAGHIINIGSIAGTEVYFGGNVYCASKHAVNALSKAMRIELLPYGIRVGQIRPGLAETEFSVVRFKGDEAKATEVYRGYQALFANDIAEAAWYMVSAPSHVCINDLEITPTAQANAHTLFRNDEKQ